MKKGYLILITLLLIIGFTGCTNQETDPSTEAPEGDMEETLEPEEEINESEEQDPISNGETCWTEMALEDTIDAVILMEGMEEEVVLNLHRSQLHPYAIYVNEERYEWQEEDGKDFLIPYQKPENMDVWMAIWHEEKTLEQAVEEKRKELETEYAETIQEDTNNPLQAVRLHALQQRDGEDVIEYWYILEAQDSGIFMIQQKLFTEAMEGHGLRFDLFLEYFYGAKAPTIQLTLTEDAKRQMEKELQLEENEGKVHVLIPGSS